MSYYYAEYGEEGLSPYQGGDVPDPDGEVMSVHQAAAELGITASTLYRWLNDGFVPGEQITPGAPWRIRLTQSIRELVADDAPAGWVPVQVATAALGVSRQTVLQSVKCGEFRAAHIRAGRKERPAYRATRLPRRVVCCPRTVKEQCDVQSTSSATSPSVKTRPGSGPGPAPAPSPPSVTS